MTIKPYIGPVDVYGPRSFTYDGYVNISFTCSKPTKQIIIHQRDLVFHSTRLYLLNNSELTETENDLEFDSIKEFLIINLITECAQNSNYTLEIVFTGPITESLTGFYRGSYLDSHGNTN